MDNDCLRRIQSKNQQLLPPSFQAWRQHALPGSNSGNEKGMTLAPQMGRGSRPQGQGSGRRQGLGSHRTNKRTLY